MKRAVPNGRGVPFREAHRVVGRIVRRCEELGVGPLEMGDGVQVGDRSVVFRVIVEDGVDIGEGPLVVGPASEDGEFILTIPAGTVIPDGTIITSQEQLDALDQLRLP
jgi:carbonic anhydrase/acetyltransferase-like protein (isoleucine patch superfamily)